MHAFDVLGDPVRRRILELLAEGETPRGRASSPVVGPEFGITQSPCRQHLKVLRDFGFATSDHGPRRLYAVDPPPPRGRRLARPFPRLLEHKLEALDTEIARGKKARR